MSRATPSAALIEQVEALLAAAAREGFLGVNLTRYGGISLHSVEPLSVGVLGRALENGAANVYLEIRASGPEALMVQVFGAASDEHPDLIARRAAHAAADKEVGPSGGGTGWLG
jgi:hypothetical protein